MAHHRHTLDTVQTITLSEGEIPPGENVRRGAAIPLIPDAILDAIIRSPSPADFILSARCVSHLAF